MSVESQDVKEAGKSAPGESGERGPVPYDRFQQVIAERNQLRGDLEALHGQHKTVSDQLSAAEQVLEQERAALREALASAARLRAATECGLPLAFADRLKGANDEELRADASRLSEYLKPVTPGVPPPASPGKPAALDLTTMTPAQIRDKRSEVWRQMKEGN